MVDDVLVQRVYDLIKALTADQTRVLLQMLSDDDGLSGVREPRRPLPESPGDAIAAATLAEQLRERYPEWQDHEAG